MVAVVLPQGQAEIGRLIKAAGAGRLVLLTTVN
jgi:hypothetical protein